MKSLNLPTSACRYCRYYQPEGRRGGCCQILGAPVQGNWKACDFAIPAFGSAWEGIEKLEKIVALSGSSTVLASAGIACALDNSQHESSEQTIIGYSLERNRTEPLVA